MIVVHADDFLSAGPGDNLKATDANIIKSFAVDIEILGGDHGHVQSLMILNN